MVLLNSWNRAWAPQMVLNLSPDEKFLYVNESVQRSIWRYNLADDWKYQQQDKISPVCRFWYGWHAL